MGRKRPKRMSVKSTSVEPGGSEKISLILTWIAIALFVLTRYYILVVMRFGSEHQPQISDMILYFEYAVRANDFHQTAYQPGFEVEYPPLAWWTINAPRLLDDRQITNPRDPRQVTPIFLEYTRAFRGLMFLCDLTSFVLLILIAQKRRPRLAGWAALIYTISTAILAHLLYDRLDVGLLVLLMLGAYTWTRSLQESGWTITWTAAAYALVGLSISYKVIPIICVPFLLLSEFYAPRRQARLTAALLALLAGIGLPFLIQYAASGPGVFALFMHHAEREIQLESLYSTLMMIAAVFGEPVFVSHSHGAFNLAGNLSHAMKILSSILLFGFLAGLGLWAVLRWSRYTRQHAYLLSCYVISSAVILSNVLSPQYFIWAFPLLLLLGIEVFPSGQIMPWILGALLVGLALMTTWIFPYNYFCSELNPHGLIPISRTDSLASSPIGYVILGLRNLTYLGMVLWLGVIICKLPRKQDKINL